MRSRAGRLKTCPINHYRNAGLKPDRLFIEGLEIQTYVGIYDWEQEQKQTVSLDLEMDCDAAAAAKTDHIDDTLNYKGVAKRMIEYVGGRRFQLIETLAEGCAQIILEEFGVSYVKVRAAKPGAIRGARTVGTLIERRA